MKALVLILAAALLFVGAASGTESQRNGGRSIGPEARLFTGNIPVTHRADPATTAQVAALSKELAKNARTLKEIQEVEKQIAALREEASPETILELNLRFVELLNRSMGRLAERRELNWMMDIKSGTLFVTRIFILRKFSRADAATVNALIAKYDIQDKAWKKKLTEAATADDRIPR